MKDRELIVDSFAGGGGASLGIELALGRGPDVAINHNPAAIAMHAANHPHTRHYSEDVFRVSPRQVTKGQPVGLLWASPDCRHFSRAKGGKPVQKSIRGLAWVVVKWAEQCSPRVIVLENVREFEDWGPVVPRWDCRSCQWKGTEGQATLGRRGKRACPRCESKQLRESKCEKTGGPLLVPDPARKGLTFRRFTGRLRNLGYAIEWKVLNAADYGAPTHRRRLFLVARNDGEPIVWPDATHGDPKKIGRDLFSGELQPWRTAAECIDWSIPCPSIFDRKKPLAEKTLRRIALGVKRYVLDNPAPFLVDMQRENRERRVDEPVGTVTTQGNKYNLVTPVVTPVTHAGERRSHPPTEPLPTITGANRGELSVVAPCLAHLAHGEGKDGRWGRGSSGIEDPVGTIHSGGKNFAVVAPTLIQVGWGERKGQSPRVPGLDKPLGTVMTDVKHALVTAFIAKHFGGVVGVSAETPLPTTTARGTQNQVVAANLIHLNHGEKQWSGADDPLRTVTATGQHAALVYSFLCKYFGSGGQWQTPAEPLHTATSKARFGLVTVTIQGEPYVLVDIGMRMLKPRELARAQGFPDSYQLTGNATQQVERIGNSVCPPVAQAIVAANYVPQALEMCA